MFPQDAPPDTSAYMVAGYTIFFLIATVYLISLVLRSRNLALDLATLEDIQAETGAKDEVDSPKALEPKPQKKAALRSKRAQPKQTKRKAAPKK